MLDVDAFQDMFIKDVTCISLDNFDSALKRSQTRMNDDNHMVMMLSCGMLPSIIRERFIARRFFTRWKRHVIARRVTYVLFHCIPHIDMTTASHLGKIAAVY